MEEEIEFCNIIVGGKDGCQGPLLCNDSANAVEWVCDIPRSKITTPMQPCHVFKRRQQAVI